MNSASCVVILAAGKGTRMKSELPKVLHQIKGRPMLSYAVATAQKLQPQQIVVVTGFGADLVQSEMGDDLVYALQEPQLGTGHAVMCAMPSVAKTATEVIVTYGDMPLLTAETLDKLRQVRQERQCAATVLTAIIDSLPPFGRIVRDAAGQFLRIVEDRDCSEEQKQIPEVNLGIYCFAVEPLRKALAGLNTNNAQGEYYLTDVLELLLGDGHQVVTVTTTDQKQAMGINNLDDLAQVESYLR